MCNRHPRMHLNKTNSAGISAEQTFTRGIRFDSHWRSFLFCLISVSKKFKYKHLQHLKNSIIAGWLNTRDELHNNLSLYWSYRDDLVVIDGVVKKGRHIIIPAVLKQQVLDQPPHKSYGYQKNQVTCMHESIYWVDINTDIEQAYKKV